MSVRTPNPKPLREDVGVEADLRDALRAESELDLAYDVDTGWERFSATMSGRSRPSGPTSAPASGKLRLGRYILHSEIGAGGMATVHLARIDGAAGFGRTVAVKRLQPQIAKDRDFVAMFVDEARLAGRIRHPNVVPTLDVVDDGGELFLVMEYIHGESLARLLRAAGKQGEVPPVRVVASIMAGVLHGLHAAHEAKSEAGQPLDIVHRDVSPQNILVDVEGVAHVLDFGVAKAAGRLYTTREGALKGKLGYMPPEAFTDTPMTRQADVYAAAVVFWEALTNRRLFLGETEGATLTRIMEAKIDPPSKHVPMPDAVDRVVMRGLSRNLSFRYATAKEMALAIEREIGIAPASELATWVNRIAHDSLAKRDAMIAAIERDASMRPSVPKLLSQPTPTEMPAVELSPPRARPTRWPIVVFALVALASLITTVTIIVRHREPQAPPSVVDHVASAIVPPTTQTTITPTATQLVVSPASAIVAASAPPRTTTEPHATTKRTALPACDPPYTTDGNGHRHYKPNCFN